MLEKIDYEKVTDNALKYGYDSLTVFNRAFQSIHGMASSVAKKENATLKSYPAIKFFVSVQGMEEMNFARIPHEWDTALENGIFSELYGLMNDKPEGLLGVMYINWK